MKTVKIKYGPASKMSYRVVQLDDGFYSFAYRVHGQLAVSFRRYVSQDEAEIEVDRFDTKLLESVTNNAPTTKYFN